MSRRLIEEGQACKDRRRRAVACRHQPGSDPPCHPDNDPVSGSTGSRAWLATAPRRPTCGRSSDRLTPLAEPTARRSPLMGDGMAGHRDSHPPLGRIDA